LCSGIYYSGGKTPLIIVAIMLGIIVIASSRLHYVEVQRLTSKPEEEKYRDFVVGG
jgi:hypothetical protein